MMMMLSQPNTFEAHVQLESVRYRLQQPSADGRLATGVGGWWPTDRPTAAVSGSTRRGRCRSKAPGYYIVSCTLTLIDNWMMDRGSTETDAWNQVRTRCSSSTGTAVFKKYARQRICIALYNTNPFAWMFLEYIFAVIVLLFFFLLVNCRTRCTSGRHFRNCHGVTETAALSNAGPWKWRTN